MSHGIAKTIDKLWNGYPISNSELADASRHFGILVSLLLEMGPVWRMPLQEAVRTNNKINDYISERGIKFTCVKIDNIAPEDVLP
jgi:hypothetical protein